MISRKLLVTGVIALAGAGTVVAASGPASAGASPIVRCSLDNTAISLIPTDAAAGRAVVRIQALNTSQRPCLLRGYPSVALLDDANAASAPQPVWTMSGPAGGLGRFGRGAPGIILKVGNVATSILEGPATAADGSACATSSTFNVGLPGRIGSAVIFESFPQCDGISVHPFIWGDNGSPRGDQPADTNADAA